MRPSMWTLYGGRTAGDDGRASAADVLAAMRSRAAHDRRQDRARLPGRPAFTT